MYYNIRNYTTKVKSFFIFGARLTRTSFDREKKLQKKPLIWGLRRKNKRYDTMSEGKISLD